VIHFDAAFLIDLQREWARERPGPAFEFMEGLDQREILAASVFAVAEIRLGAELARRPDKAHKEVDDVLSGLLVVVPTEMFAFRYAREARALQRNGSRIPTMDLLIGVTALLDDAPLVTRNVKDFSRIPGLRVLSY
jgi:predicted nucleic acid-binding protein